MESQGIHTIQGDSGQTLKIEDMEEDRFRESAQRHLRFLRDKLISDLTAAEKVFIFRCTDKMLNDNEIFELHAAMREYGNNVLLYVRLADPANPEGAVKNLAPGLFVGHLNRFAAGANGEGLGPNTEGWFSVLKSAFDQIDGHQPAAYSTSDPGTLNLPAEVPFDAALIPHE
jgi:hypothetical protein